MSDDYYTIRTRDLSDLPLRSRPSPMRAALVFSSAAVALAVLVAPELTPHRVDAVASVWSDRVPGANRLPGIDRMAVGSIEPVNSFSVGALGLRGSRRFEPGEFAERARATEQSRGGMAGSSVERRSYIVRRSVLSEGSVCVIQTNGVRTGAC